MQLTRMTEGLLGQESVAQLDAVAALPLPDEEFQDA